MALLNILQEATSLRSTPKEVPNEISKVTTKINQQQYQEYCLIRLP